jgi:hypothetical protein
MIVHHKFLSVCNQQKNKKFQKKAGFQCNISRSKMPLNRSRRIDSYFYTLAPENAWDLSIPSELLGAFSICFFRIFFKKDCICLDFELYSGVSGIQ